jgi:hypothetical protein
VIDVACVAKTERDTTEHQGDNQDNSRNSPAGGQSTPHESVSNYHLPTDLQVERQRPQEYPHHTTPTSRHQESARKGAGSAGAHIIRGDGIEALLRLRTEGNYEAELSMKISERSMQIGFSDYLPRA